jgi:hypothetical protein
MTGCEIIPEEDEDKLKTEYATTKKFYELSNVEPFINNSKNIDPDKHEDMIEEKIEIEIEQERPMFFKIKIKKNLEKIQVNHTRQVSARDKSSLESPSTREFTCDSVKNNKDTNIKKFYSPSITGENKPKYFNFETIGKLNPREQILSDRGEIRENFKMFLSPEKNYVSKTRVFNQEDRINLQSRAKSRENSLKIKTREDVLEFKIKPRTPSDIKLPIIKKTQENLNKPNCEFNKIKSILNLANNFKEDPILQKKMENILQNIDDIRNVINQKNKNRSKIFSAPANNTRRLSFATNMKPKVKESIVKEMNRVKQNEKIPIKVFKK